MSEVLPKKRGNHSHHNNNNRVYSNLQELSSRGRVISGRQLSKSKRVISNRGSNDPNGSFGEDAINFDLNRNTIMSNFEEWIKLSTDNKITTKNSWQFALIDYFHDLNVIKDGDDINFQRASATLDGCVKIYSSRVESVATETGKLLSGLAKKRNEQGDEDDVDDEDQQDPENGDENLNEAGEGKRARKINRVMESTLVLFDTIRIKKLDQELAIDPLFKKALAEFDEGGAKSLLLNTLSIDNSGRVVFDATTSGNSDGNVQEESQDLDHKDINLNKIESMLFKKENGLDDTTICPSIEQLKIVLNDIDQAKSILGDVNNKYLNDNGYAAASDAQMTPGDFDFGNYDNDGNEAMFDDLGGDIYEDKMDGKSVIDKSGLEGDNAGAEKGDEEPEEYAMGPGNQILDEDLMAYFDETMKSNWRGPEHWKVAAYKKSKNIAEHKTEDSQTKNTATTHPKPAKSKKQSQIVNFFDEDDEDDDILSETAPVAMLNKKEERPETLLPDDIQYNSTKLINLFLKPNNSIMYYPKVPRNKQQSSSHEPQLTDENYFADQYNQQDRMTSFHQAQFEEINKDYEDDGDVFGGIDFNDALEDLSPYDQNSGGNNGEGNGNDNKQNLLIGGRKVRPEYVNFSRIAKRVDVKLLKDNLWKGIKLEADNKSELDEKNEEQKENNNPEEEEQTEGDKDKEDASVQVKQEKRFVDLVENIGKMYSNEERKDLSTSFCFICLLHLANEHGLDVMSNEGHDDLRITGF